MFFIEGIVQWLLSLVVSGISSVMDFFIDLFGGLFTAQTETFMHTFPIVGEFQKAFTSIGFSLCLLFMVLALFRNIFSGLGFAGEKPLKMGIRFIIAIFIVLYAGTFMTYIFENTFKSMYETVDAVGSGINGAGATLQGLNSPGGFAASAAQSAVENGVIIQLVVALIVIILIALNLFKLLIEMVERYLMVNVLIFFAPLIGASVTLESTIKVFQTYCKMFFGHLMLLLLNIVSLRIVGSGLNQLSFDLDPINEVSHTIIFADILLIVAFLKIAQRFDSYLRDIGVTVGITGGNLTDEILTAGKTISHTAGKILGGSSDKGGGGKGGGLLSKLPGGAAGAALFGGAVAGPGGAVVGGAFSAVKKTGTNLRTASKIRKAGGEMDGASLIDAFGAVSVANNPNSLFSKVSPVSAAKRAQRIMSNPLNSQQAMTGRAAKNAVTALYRNKIPVTAAKIGTDAAIFKGENGHWYRATSKAPTSDIGVRTYTNSVTGKQDYIQDLTELNKHSLDTTGKASDLYATSIEQFNDSKCNSLSYPPPEPEVDMPTQADSPQGKVFVAPDVGNIDSLRGIAETDK